MSNLNLVFFGNFPFPYAQGKTAAGTKRVRFITEGISKSGYNPSVLVIFQHGERRLKHGIFNNIEYFTLYLNKKKIFIPFIIIDSFRKGFIYLKGKKIDDGLNILYLYSSLTIEKLPVVLIAKLLNYKIVIELVEDDKIRYKEAKFPNSLSLFLSIYLFKLFKFLFDGGIGINQHLTSLLISCGVKSIHIPVCVPEMRLEWSSISYANKTFTLVYCGNYSSNNSIDNLILSLALVNRPVKLLLVGKIDSKPLIRLKKIVSAHNLNLKVEFVGFVEEKVLMDIYSSSDLLCMVRDNSTFSNTGFPFKLGEYLSTGKPVMTTMVSDISNYLRNKESAIIIRNNSAEEIAEGIQFCFDNQSELELIGKNGKEIWSRYFNSDNNSKHLLEFLKTLQ